MKYYEIAEQKFVNKSWKFVPVHGTVHCICYTTLIFMFLPVVKLGENDYIYVTIKPQFQIMLHDSFFTLSFISKKYQRTYTERQYLTENEHQVTAVFKHNN